ncbi:alpha/beta-hydrolase [Gymnopus androsaceus JB14]|uniref:Alpha/beta-hydrolase n=1 Tax=Gymnopus androsaceus JB14 TaxID=1447944 RepID=A0A6A4GY97_9AGAR|nr:alpha/beta-hydrolase [Gymnopus androsaceus JB14]
MSSFKISVSSSALTALKSRLEGTIFPDELDGAGWDYGVPLADIKRLVTRWRDGFDWRKEEERLNTVLPQFTRDIEVEGFGILNIHYIHQKSEKVDGIPLLFVHGWPGNFLEVRGLSIAQFDVVAISLPGYGFSQGPKKKGFSLVQYAEVSHKLMLSLGYTEYVTQGGDWGSAVSYITREIASRYGGEHAKAWHTNSPFSCTPYELEGLSRMEISFQSGYFKQQSTKPQTLGYSLADSPVGLLAWIYEKLVGWSDSYPWTDDEVLTWVSIYWFSRAGPTASLRIYYEVMNSGQGFDSQSTVPKIPMGCSLFPKELEWDSKKYTHLLTHLHSWYPRIGNVVFEAEHDSGGHFAAYEKPELLVGDLQKMFGKGGPAFGVVSGRNGYSN